MKRWFGLRALTLAAGALGLTACTVGPDYQRPKLSQGAGYAPQPLPRQTSSADAPGGAAQRFEAGADIPAQWWTLYHSASLDALIDEALAANPDIAAAQAALRQAREISYADESGLFPQVGGQASATRQKAGAAPAFNVTSASLNVGYSPDVFGGVRRQIESSQAQAEFQRFELEATYLTLTANVVNSAVTLASLRDQIAATEAIEKIEHDALEVVRRQYLLGAVPQSDLLAQEAALAQTRASLPPLQKDLAQARNQLMTYLGRYPSQDAGESFELASLALPEDLPVSLPSNLVEQRPDVRAAEAELHAASAEIGVAVAAQLPQFSITAQLGQVSGAGIWSLAGAVTQTIFDAGAAEHRKRAAVAAYDEAEALYRKAVLLGFQDVANSLRALEADAQALDADAVAERSAKESLDLAIQQYRLGAIDQVALLNAQTTYETAVLARVRAQAARYSDTAALFQALGGGWWNRNDAPPPDAHPVRFVLPPISARTDPQSWEDRR
jgi:NodT family efflux transporter outer membrane factor (OMF) lipoprotein